MPTDATVSVYSFSFVFIRFLGNEVFDLSGLVSVRSEIVPQVKFLKSQPEECQNCEPLCKVTMRRTSHVSRTCFGAALWSVV